MDESTDAKTFMVPNLRYVWTWSFSMPDSFFSTDDVSNIVNNSTCSAAAEGNTISSMYLLYKVKFSPSALFTFQPPRIWLLLSQSFSSTHLTSMNHVFRPKTRAYSEITQRLPRILIICPVVTTSGFCGCLKPLVRFDEKFGCALFRTVSVSCFLLDNWCTDAYIFKSAYFEISLIVLHWTCHYKCWCLALLLQVSPWLSVFSSR